MTRYNFIKFLTLFIISLLTVGLFISSPAPHNRILNIQNYLITVSGIISGIMIAYLSSKLFNIKQERSNRQAEINLLADKLTNYRRILYAIMKSHEYWVKYNDIKEFKQKYPGLNFERLHSQQEDDKLSTKFWLEERDLSLTTVDLYSAMEAIYGETEEFEMSWVYDRTIDFSYSLEELYKYYMPSNQIWYYLEGRFYKHTDGLIRDKKIWVLFKDKVRDWFAQIDSKFRDREIDRHLLAEVSTDFHEYTLPKLIELTKTNTAGLPKQVVKLFSNLVFIFIIGVIFPLFIQSMYLQKNWDILLTLSSVGVVIISFIYFFFDLYKLMVEEIQPKR